MTIALGRNKKLKIYKLEHNLVFLDNKSHDIVLLARNEEEARLKASVFDEHFKSSNVRCYEMGVASRDVRTGGGLKSPWMDIISIHTEIDSLKETQTLGNKRAEEETPRRVYLVYYNSYYSDQRCSITETWEVESGLLDRFCTGNNLKIIGKYYIREEAEAKLKEVREKGLPRT